MHRMRLVLSQWRRCYYDFSTPALDPSPQGGGRSALPSCPRNRFALLLQAHAADIGFRPDQEGWGGDEAESLPVEKAPSSTGSSASLSAISVMRFVSPPRRSASESARGSVHCAAQLEQCEMER